MICDYLRISESSYVYLDIFISDSVTFRPRSMFLPDINANRERLTEEIKGRIVCVIGGAGSTRSSFIKAVLRFESKSVVVVDLNENGLAELVRDVRSTEGLYVLDEFRCYSYASPTLSSNGSSARKKASTS